MNKNEIVESVKLIFDKIVYVVEFLVSLLLAVEIFEIVTVIAYLKYIPYITIVIAIVLLIALVAIIYYLLKTRKDKIEKMFLTVAIPLSVVFAVFILPLHVPDEDTHIVRAYDMSLGHIFVNINEDGNSSCTVVKDLENISMINYDNLIYELQKDTNYSEEIQEVSAAQNYSPFLYIGSSIAFFISRTLGINIFYGIYLGRLFNAIIFLSLGYLSIKKIPLGKLALAICLCMPMMLQQAASCSADAILNAVLVYFIVHIFYMVLKKEEITIKDKILLYCLTALIAMFKYVYIVVIGLLFIAFFTKKEARKQFLKTSIIMIIIGTIFSTTWLAYGLRYNSLPKSMETYVKYCDINFSDQINYVVNNPGQFIQVLGEHYVQKSKDEIDQSIGSKLGRFTQEVNPMIIFTFMIILVLSAITEKNENALSKGAKIWTLLIFFAVTILINIVMYLVFTPVGYNEILGVQGRYFSPLLILILLCLIRKDKNYEIKNISERMFITAFILNILTIIQVGNVYL